MQHYYIINQTNFRRKAEIFGIKTVTILNKNIDNRIYKNRDNKIIIFLLHENQQWIILKII